MPVGVAAGSAYAVLCISPSLLGLVANTEHFVLLSVLGGTLPEEQTCKNERENRAFPSRFEAASQHRLTAAIRSSQQAGFRLD
jgi:hypothetical protein